MDVTVDDARGLVKKREVDSVGVSQRKKGGVGCDTERRETEHVVSQRAESTERGRK